MLSLIKSGYVNVSRMDHLQDIRDGIHNICFHGREKQCNCPEPMNAAGRLGNGNWLKASHENRDVASSMTEDVDVVFYGDSITEGWKGSSVFESLFTLEGGGKYKGVPLGISGDRTTDLLWRLQNGEMPQSLNPKVFWLLIGTNDMGGSWCSPEATFLGILRVVEEIRTKKEGTLIVMNSIMPRTFNGKGYMNKAKSTDDPPPLWNVIKNINAKLKEYSSQHENLVFFDVNDSFFVDSSARNKDLRLDQNLMHDYLHPSSVGYKLWGDQIVKKLDELI